MYIYSLQTQIHITQNRIRIMEAEKNITAAILKSSMKNMNLSEVKNLIYYGANRTVAAQFNTLEMIDKYTHPMTASLVKRFPRCICIGVAKAGTTALQAFLNMHPTVVAATWEPRFFSRFSHKGFNFIYFLVFFSMYCTLSSTVNIFGLWLGCDRYIQSKTEDKCQNILPGGIYQARDVRA